jgi:hypothetical protein
MEAINSSETSVTTYKTKRRRNKKTTGNIRTPVRTSNTRTCGQCDTTTKRVTVHELVTLQYHNRIQVFEL